MPRVFVSFAVANLLCLLGSGALGIASDSADADRHVVLSVFTLVLSCLLQVFVFTYFTISGKVVGQAVHLGGLAPELITQCKRLKKQVTLLLAIVFVALVLATATGANAWRTAEHSSWHLGAAGLALLMHLYSWMREYSLIVEQGQILTVALAEYERHKQSLKGKSENST